MRKPSLIHKELMLARMPVSPALAAFTRASGKGWTASLNACPADLAELTAAHADRMQTELTAAIQAQNWTKAAEIIDHIKRGGLTTTAKP